MGANKIVETGAALIVTMLLIIAIPWGDILSDITESFISIVPVSSFQSLIVSAIIACFILLSIAIVRNDLDDLFSALSDFIYAIVETISSIIETLFSLFR